jgi:hypothetical protein
MAIGATHFVLEHGMMVGQLERGADFRVALKTGGGRSPWIDDLRAVAAAFYMETAGTVTRFAAHVLGVVALRLYSGVRRRGKTFGNRFMAGRAFFRADKFRSRNAGRGHDRPA